MLQLFEWNVIIDSLFTTAEYVSAYISHIECATSEFDHVRKSKQFKQQIVVFLLYL